MLLIYFLVIIFVIYLLHETVPVARYYVKFSMFLLISSVGALICLLPFGIRGRSYQNAWIFQHVFQFAGYCVGLRPKIKGSHHLNPAKPHIYLSNHQSCIDLATLGPVWPKRCTVIAKSSLIYAIPVSLIMWLSKVIFVNREKRQSALNSMKYAAEVAVADQVSIYVFPEGTRSSTGLLPFKKGAFHLAIDCQFPIQPVVVAPYETFLDHNKKKFDGASYIVQVLPAIPTTGKTAADIDDLLHEVYSQMKRCYDELKVPSLVAD